MSKGNEKADFAINLTGNSAQDAKSIGDAMASMRERISGGVASIRDMNASLRNLKGAGSGATAAQNELKEKIKKTKEEVAKLTLEQLKAEKAADKLGVAVKKVASAEDVAKARTKALGAAVDTAGGPLAELRSKFETVKAVLGEGGAGGKLAVFTLGLGLAAVALAALGVAAVGAVASLAKFVVSGADAARSAALLREAAMGGNATWGKNFGEQVDALAKRIPTARAELQQLGIALSKQNIGGQLWVDSMNAVAQASAALGDDAGRKLQSFIERGMVLGKPGLFRLNPQELIGTGVTFQEVAEQLGKSMHVGVADAQKALFEGRVKLGDGAAAMRAAVEKKFAGINLRQMLSLDNLSKKFGETLQDLTKGVDIEPLLNGLKELASLFDTSTVTGNALKTIINVFGKDLVSTFQAGVPLAQKFIEGLIIGGLELTIMYLKVRNALRDAFNGSVLKDIDLVSVALGVGKVVVGMLAVGLATAAAAIGVVVVAVGGLAAAVYGAVQGVKELWKSLTTVDWGDAIIDGLVKGITAGWERAKNAMKGLAGAIKNAFTGSMKIQSPSKVFEQYGRFTTEGFERGVDAGSSRAQASVDNMVAPPSPSAGGGGAVGEVRASGAPLNVSITINASGGNAKEVAAQVSSEATIAQITKALVEALRGAGYPVPT